MEYLTCIKYSVELKKYLIEGIIRMWKHVFFFKINAKKIPKGFLNRAINCKFYDII